MAAPLAAPVPTRRPPRVGLGSRLARGVAPRSPGSPRAAAALQSRGSAHHIEAVAVCADESAALADESAALTIVKVVRGWQLRRRLLRAAAIAAAIASFTASFATSTLAATLARLPFARGARRRGAFPARALRLLQQLPD